MTPSVKSSEAPASRVPSSRFTLSGAPASRVPPPRAARFTLDGDDALERHLQVTCDRVVSGVRGIIPEKKLRAIVLGGGYGRGEGGVLRPGPAPHAPCPTAPDRPYNDLEFYVVVRGNRHAAELLYRRALEVLGHILTHLADVEVEFKIATLAELTARPPSMFSYDLLAGHRLVYSDEPGRQCLAAVPAADDIPLSEATRLLMNRCTGLLLASEFLSRPTLPDPSAEFVRRNIAKAELACGDALLTAHRRYHWSCLERARRLEQLAAAGACPLLNEVRRHHAAGVAFKLRPQPGPQPGENLAAQLAAVSAVAMRCWLAIEEERLGRSFLNVRAYVDDPGPKLPGTSALRNFLTSARLGDLRSLASHPTRPPRERLLRTLPILLWIPTPLADPRLRALLRRDLGRPVQTLPEAIAAYRSLWEQVR